MDDAAAAVTKRIVADVQMPCPGTINGNFDERPTKTTPEHTFSLVSHSDGPVTLKFAGQYSAELGAIIEVRREGHPKVVASQPEPTSNKAELPFAAVRGQTYDVTVRPLLADKFFDDAQGRQRFGQEFGWYCLAAETLDQDDED
jgi:hypothetical protein